MGAKITPQDRPTPWLSRLYPQWAVSASHYAVLLGIQQCVAWWNHVWSVCGVKLRPQVFALPMPARGMRPMPTGTQSVYHLTSRGPITFTPNPQAPFPPPNCSALIWNNRSRSGLCFVHVCLFLLSFVFLFLYSIHTKLAWFNYLANTSMTLCVVYLYSNCGRKSQVTIAVVLYNHRLLHLSVDGCTHGVFIAHTATT